MLSRKRFATAVRNVTNDRQFIAGKSSTLQCIVSTQQLSLRTPQKDQLALGKVHISKKSETSHTPQTHHTLTHTHTQTHTTHTALTHTTHTHHTHTHTHTPHTQHKHTTHAHKPHTHTHTTHTHNIYIRLLRLSFGLEYAIRRVQANLERYEIKVRTYRFQVYGHDISSFRKYMNVLHTRTGQLQHTVLR
jgi:hypothetical protein